MTSACRCTDGRAGAQSCQPDRTLNACECDTGICNPGAKLTCACADNATGEQLCDGSRTFLDCICPSSKRIFVTSTLYSGNLGGLSGADAKCLTAAQSVNLPGTWKAWLSSSTINAIDRIAEVGPWYFVGVDPALATDRRERTRSGIEQRHRASRVDWHQCRRGTRRYCLPTV